MECSFLFYSFLHHPSLAGGFIVTQKMLDLFRRSDDPPEYNQYYLAPFGVLGAGYFAAKGMGIGGASLTPTIALASGLGCVGSIAAL